MENVSFSEVLSTTHYEPRTLKMEFQGQRLFGSLSMEARVFLYRALDLEPPSSSISVGQLYGKRWGDDPELMKAFSLLSTNIKMEVLAFVTLFLHEMTHHLDFLSTPFSLNFHAKTIREYWSLQDFAPVMLENPELIPPRLVDFAAHLDATRTTPPGELDVHGTRIGHGSPKRSPKNSANIGTRCVVRS